MRTEEGLYFVSIDKKGNVDAMLVDEFESGDWGFAVFYCFVRASNEQKAKLEGEAEKG